MTYQTANDHSAFHSAVGGLRAAITAVGDVLKSIGKSYMDASVASSRMHLIRTLQGKSDAELAHLGLKREDITRHVLRDIYYL
ncbi:hypothetical protein ABMC88_06265 [Sulfitobacter sp. HNIBRBA2951]|uniref:hypothetical protein n=1 Tax=Sulfitobacter aquimarinus TaxID=3158557 RepID=UPI0032DF1D78